MRRAPAVRWGSSLGDACAARHLCKCCGRGNLKCAGRQMMSAPSVRVPMKECGRASGKLLQVARVVRIRVSGLRCVVGASANVCRRNPIRRAILSRAIGCLGIGTDHRLPTNPATYRATDCLRVGHAAEPVAQCPSISRMAFVPPTDAWRAIHRFPVLAVATLGRGKCDIGKWHSIRL